MRRLYVRIVAVLLTTALLSLVGFVGVFLKMTAPAVEELLLGVQTFTLEETIDALQDGGPERVAAVLASRRELTHATNYLTDAAGRDVVTGEDRSAMLAAAADSPLPVPVDGSGRRVIVRASKDNRFRLITIATPPFGFLDILPYYTLLLVAVALICWVLAVHIVSPLTRMASVVEEFGRGHLAARTGIRRGDEIGELARAVDRMAERIEVLVSAERRLLADVSHELRSPLTRLNLSVELSRTMTDRNAAAARLQRDIDRLSQIVRTLLEVTRLEGEGLNAPTVPVDIDSIVAEVIEDAEIEADARRVRIATEIAPATTPGDRELLRRAVENVLRNAIRHAPPDSTVDVRVSTTGGRVSISIRDYGAGVPSDTLSKLGTPFFRVESARDSASGGVGLGLSIAKRGIERHNGDWIVQNANPGLSITMTIPAFAQAGAPTESKGMARPA
jgi:signal transduction histidine kinase